MRPISREELREIQMQILDAVDAFCGEHLIKYSIACGTLLGAVRHGGYIPWDDDIDIYMLRNDYERFESLFPDIYLDRFSLFSSKKNNRWHLPYGKVADIRTVMQNDLVNVVPVGVNIDVFIIDEVPDNDVDWFLFRKKQLKLIHQNLYHTYRFRLRAGIRQNFRTLYCKIKCGVSQQRIIKRITNYICQFNGKGYSWCFEAVQGIRAKHPFEKKIFDDIIDWKFENRLYKGFRNANHYLKNTFGDDFMELPPKEKRMTHHPDKAFWLK